MVYSLCGALLAGASTTLGAIFTAQVAATRGLFTATNEVVLPIALIGGVVGGAITFGALRQRMFGNEKAAAEAA